MGKEGGGVGGERTKADWEGGILQAYCLQKEYRSQKIKWDTAKNLVNESSVIFAPSPTSQTNCHHKLSRTQQFSLLLSFNPPSALTKLQWLTRPIAEWLLPNPWRLARITLQIYVYSDFFIAVTWHSFANFLLFYWACVSLPNISVPTVQKAYKFVSIIVSC